MHTIAFFNVENLFDTKNEQGKNDRDFLPNSTLMWTKNRYYNKLQKLGYAISKIGETETGKSPAIIGLAEIENIKVLQDLTQSPFLKKLNYSYVHYESPDERGIDVGLLYNPDVFTVQSSRPIMVDLDTEASDVTRDVLLVVGTLNKEKVHILVNHWPSRREGVKATEPKRLKASEVVSEYLKKQQTGTEKTIIMGDFNDEPFSNSIRHLVTNNNLYNPMNQLYSYSRGSLKYRNMWLLFDQILISTNFFETNKGHLSFEEANIFDPQFLKEYKGFYKGSPFRTYAGEKYRGGYSDHFPVYIIVKTNT